jgi:hypothetical protein
MSIPLALARVSRKGKSKKSPLKVARMVGFVLRMWVKKRVIVAA